MHATRKRPWLVNEIESRMLEKQFGINTLDWIDHPRFYWLKDELKRISRIGSTCEMVVLCNEMILTLQNLHKSTQLYPDKDPGNGERVGIHFMLTGPSGLGKNAGYKMLVEINKRFRHLAEEFIKKYKIQYNLMEINYLFTVSRLKAAYLKAKDRNGQGIIAFVEGCKLID